MNSPDGGGRRRQAERVALISLLAALGLVAAKLAAGLASGSLAVLSEAAHSALDAGVTALTYVSIRIASKPPDANHPYGHGKAENISALLETVALLGLSMYIALHAITRLRSDTVEATAAWYTFAVIGLSIVVDLSRATALRSAARTYKSAALEADALHFTADLLSSIAVLIGLVFVRLGFPQADSITSLAIAAYVAAASLSLGRRAVSVLMDVAPAGAVQSIEEAAAAVQGVEEVRRVRVRYAGGKAQTDVIVAISRTMPLETAHLVTEEVERVIRAIEPGADVVVHVEPLADEALIRQKVLSLAALESEATEVHNIYVTDHDDGIHISLHAKFPGSMPVVTAHAISDRLEEKIVDQIAGVVRVDTHMEPLDSPGERGSDVTANESTLVAWTRALALQLPEVEDCHEVLVTRTGSELVVVVHCTAAPGLSIEQAHQASTRIENEVHGTWREVGRVTVHFEPG
ncbi:MAG TPA: cation-efflux pump [Actinomycetota bacterium]|nr:cation-efflux pump [Actinomycetota bacterium]